jgi:hypothetical protein
MTPGSEPGGMTPEQLAFIRWLHGQTAKYNHDEWRKSRWWKYIVAERSS